ncbi:ArsR/SmtB family transcription factor [Actinoallomurus iriomotensis]|uniref:Transcriptional regulator n=1 Tax=Actinoallomurus iriomotensis TaxID=478107 RepID=A0A9W6S952_9ACTN|nr:helix-turn-helix transcriptional regulator [Actinoallomurus iriomotensis]GLY89343.1 transcriptional regulator [Actinoallomurus iriomotensis]
MDLGKVFAALSDDSRRRVVAELADAPTDGERPCGSFDLPVGKATRTHHFRVLREAGLIDQRHHGNGSAVSLRRDTIERHLPGLLPLLVRELHERED